MRYQPSADPRATEGSERAIFWVCVGSVCVGADYLRERVAERVCTIIVQAEREIRRVARTVWI